MNQVCRYDFCAKNLCQIFAANVADSVTMSSLSRYCIDHFRLASLAGGCGELFGGTR